jgi:hypothetical protein
VARLFAPIVSLRVVDDQPHEIEAERRLSCLGFNRERVGARFETRSSARRARSSLKALFGAESDARDTWRY